ncbi:MAG: peptidoglycan -binding protein [Alphaproteobacteria bacterium]|nr:peptidoglycan -binding protein [Alphaproteobacteria bacterium]
MPTARVRYDRSSNIWPGFVDALATLLLVITFLLSVFLLAYFFVSQALSGREEALSRLSQQVNELAELLSLERQANSELRLNVAQISASLQKSTEERELLGIRLDEFAARAASAGAALIDAAAMRAELEAALEEAERKVTADRETIELRLKEIASLRRDIASLREVRDDLEGEVGTLSAALQERERETGTLRDRTTELERETGALRDRAKELEARLASEQERTLLAQKDITERDIRLSELLDIYAGLASDLEAEREVSAGARSQIALLNQQVAALREQLKRIAAALDVSEAKSTEQNVVIADLGRRLNLALASKVEELARYRSEFFGRLREVLGNRRDIRIVGDRFVFQSEVLFESGSAELGIEGAQQLAALAMALIEIARQIPAELHWILRVDGHTDRVPIATARFPTNWELSTARALSVTHFLVAQGIPPDRLAATGFGEFQPLDPRNDEIAFRRNRRIELKLTQR